MDKLGQKPSTKIKENILRKIITLIFLTMVKSLPVKILEWLIKRIEFITLQLIFEFRAFNIVLLTE